MVSHFSMRIKLFSRRMISTEAVAWRCSLTKVVLRTFAKKKGKHLYQTESLFLKRESGTGVFL